MENNLYPIGGMVEELYPTNLIEYWIVRVVCHVMCYNSRISSPFECVYPSLKQDLIWSRDQVLRIREFRSWFAVPSRCLIE
jgi:hypothetical protein